MITKMTHRALAPPPMSRLRKMSPKMMTSSQNQITKTKIPSMVPNRSASG